MFVFINLVEFDSSRVGQSRVGLQREVKFLVVGGIPPAPPPHTTVWTSFSLLHLYWLRRCIAPSPSHIFIFNCVPPHACACMHPTTCMCTVRRMSSHAFLHIHVMRGVHRVCCSASLGPGCPDPGPHTIPLPPVDRALAYSSIIRHARTSFMGQETLATTAPRGCGLKNLKTQRKFCLVGIW